MYHQAISLSPQQPSLRNGCLIHSNQKKEPHTVSSRFIQETDGARDTLDHIVKQVNLCHT
jgi:hypothetical protein